jgi:hypothetical protein
MLNFTFSNLEKYIEDNIKTSPTISVEKANQLQVIIDKINTMMDKNLFDPNAKTPIFHWMRVNMTLKLLLESNRHKLTQALSKTHEEPTKLHDRD